VEVESQKLDNNGMVVDCSLISHIVKQLDHQYLNDILGCDINPTAENIAMWVAKNLNANMLDNPTARVSKVTVQESEGNVAWFIP
jgi:6-pyruvoyltetrahydropterin/6-carboxytetrahydropterin synthase